MGTQFRPFVPIGIEVALLTMFPICMITELAQPVSPCGTVTYIVSTAEQQALRPRNSTSAGWPPMNTFRGMFVKSVCCAGCDSSSETAPSPVAHNVTISPGLGALLGETTVLVAGSVATASPAPVVFKVNTPILFATTTIGAVALARPL